MTQNHEKKSKDMTLKSIKAELRRFSELKAPETLKARLLAAIPDKQAKVAQEYQVQYYRAWDFGVTAVAAVLIFALMFMLNYGLSVPTQILLTDINDTSLVYPKWDQHYLPYDHNSILLKVPTSRITLPNGRLK